MPTPRTLPWLPTEIRAKLETDNVWLERAVIVIWERQTRDEQESHATNHENGMGFTGCDADFLTSMAEWINRGRRPLGERLTEKQRVVTRKKMLKYAGQLAKVANERRLAALQASGQQARDALHAAIYPAGTIRPDESDIEAERRQLEREYPATGCAPDHDVECPTCMGHPAPGRGECPTCRGRGVVGELTLIDQQYA